MVEPHEDLTREYNISKLADFIYNNVYDPWTEEIKVEDIMRDIKERPLEVLSMVIESYDGLIKALDD